MALGTFQPSNIFNYHRLFAFYSMSFKQLIVICITLSIDLVLAVGGLSRDVVSALSELALSVPGIMSCVCDRLLDLASGYLDSGSDFTRRGDLQSAQRVLGDLGKYRRSGHATEDRSARFVERSLRTPAHQAFGADR